MFKKSEIKFKLGEKTESNSNNFTPSKSPLPSSSYFSNEMPINIHQSNKNYKKNNILHEGEINCEED